jgi:F-type H+-transporting ATPase subunit epsilon
MLPAEKGYVGILPGHTPFLSRIGIGEVIYRIGDKKHFLALSGGFVEVSDDSVVVLARSAELPEEIDKDRAEQSRKRAEDRLQGKTPEIDFVRAEAALRRAMMRLAVREP